MINKTTLVGFQTLLYQEVRRFLRIWPQTLLPPAITMTLYFIIFGHFVGSRIGSISGVSYIQYIAPGLVMLQIINGAYGNVSSSFYGSKFQRNIDELLVAPLPNYVILAGYVLGGVLRALVVGAIVSCVALFFTHLKLQHVGLTFAISFLAAVLFALTGFFNGLFARNFDDVTIIPTFVLTPLTYLGGVFYSVNLLPTFWRDASYFNPILYIVNAFREGFFGVSDINSTWALLMVFVFVVIMTVVNLKLLKSGRGLKP